MCFLSLQIINFWSLMSSTLCLLITQCKRSTNEALTSMIQRYALSLSLSLFQRRVEVVARSGSRVSILEERVFEL